ncbi:MAG: hypothetical protein ABSF45_15140 [Terriglobia bacterium]|jgi:hypothetical protein
MLKAYVNYPNPKVTIHRDPSCQSIQKMAKQRQRFVRINPKTISTELQRFKAKGYAFAANAAGNDMWLEADFGDAAFEVAVVKYVHHLIGEHYAPLGKAIIGTHC